MLASELISETIPALKTSDSGVQALTWMEIFRVKHLPIVNHREFLGLISDQDIYDLNDADEPVGNHTLSLKKPYVNEGQHIYELIEVLSRLDLSLVPVLNEEKHYLGVVTQEDLTKTFAHLSCMQNPGGIVVLEMSNNDYSLTEIANIVEGNDGKILSMYVSSSEDPSRMQVTLKLNITDLTSILETFNRYNYHIFASYMTSENLDEFYQDRYDEFINYLNI